MRPAYIEIRGISIELTGVWRKLTLVLPNPLILLTSVQKWVNFQLIDFKDFAKIRQSPVSTFSPP